MTTKVNRRQALKWVAFGASGLLAACTSAPAAQQPVSQPAIQSQPQSTEAPVPSVPSAAPTTAASPTIAPAATDSPENAPSPTTQASGSTALPAPGSAQTQAASAYAPGMAVAATKFLDALDDAQRTRATFAFDDAERTRWHWTTPSNFPRNGLPLREMNQGQKDAAFALLQASVSSAGYQKTLDIMSLQNDLGNDPELYYLTVFGAPGSTEPWSWRWEGHHVSRHFTVVEDQVAVTPFFHGAWPTISSTGLRAMPREEDAARELVQSLNDAGRATAIFQPRTLTRHVTWNEAYVSPLDPVGMRVGDLNPDQQSLVTEIINAYLNAQVEPVAADHLGRLQSAGLEQVRFGWAGPLEARRPHYYRLQGPTFLLEFDNSRNGGTHIHSVWRDFTGDFGRNLV